MGKVFLPIFCAMLVLASGVLLGADDEQNSRSKEKQVHVVLHDRSEIDWANLSIDGENKGVVQKGEPLVVSLREGSTYLFRVSRSVGGKHYLRERFQLIEKGPEKQWVVLSPELQNSDGNEARGYINITLSPDSSIAWANLLINNASYGVLQRKETRRFWLRAGMTHHIRLERTWKGRAYFAEHSMNVKEGQTVGLSLVPKAQE
jgi:hypothetical protein